MASLDTLFLCSAALQAWLCSYKKREYFESTADALINESVNDSNNIYQTLLETALQLQQIMAKTSNNVDDDTLNNIEH